MYEYDAAFNGISPSGNSVAVVGNDPTADRAPNAPLHGAWWCVATGLRSYGNVVLTDDEGRARMRYANRDRYAHILTAALAGAVVFALFPFLSGFVGAAVLAMVVAPVHTRLARRLGLRFAGVICTVGALIVVLVPGAALVAMLVAQAPAAARAVSQSRILQELAALQIAGIDVGALADAAVSAVLTWVSRQAMALVSGLTLATLNIVIATFSLYYLLITDGGRWSALRALLPFSSRTIAMLADRFRTTTQSMIIGVVLTAVAQGTVVGGAFALVGLPSAGFWGFVTACASVLPVLGSSLVWFPGTLVLVADHRYGAAFALGAIGVLVASQIDNVIRPLVYRRVSRIHPLVTLVGAFAGMRIFGFAGLLLGPLAISWTLELVEAYAVEIGASARTALTESAAD